MPFVEVFASGVRDDQKQAISERLVAEVMKAEGAPDCAPARSISWLVWQEVSAWSVGGRPVGTTEPPRYVVRVAVPAGSMDEQERADVIGRVTAVLAEVDDDPKRLYRQPDAWVHVSEIPEGAWGALGRQVRFPDIANYVLTGAIA